VGTVAAIFDDSVALGRAVSKLQEAGLGDDILEVQEGEVQEGAAGGARQDTPHNPAFLPAAGMANLYGGASRTTPAAADAPNTPSRLGSLGDDAEPFRRSLEHGGKLVILETDDVDTALATLRDAGAQRLYPNRG